MTGVQTCARAIRGEVGGLVSIFQLQFTEEQFDMVRGFAVSVCDCVHRQNPVEEQRGRQIAGGLFGHFKFLKVGFFFGVKKFFFEKKKKKKRLAYSHLILITNHD